MLFSDKTTMNKPTHRRSSFCHLLKKNDTLLWVKNKNSNNNTLKKKEFQFLSMLLIKKGVGKLFLLYWSLRISVLKRAMNQPKKVKGMVEGQAID